MDAINDGNVLPFRIDYVNTVKEKEDVKDSQVRAIDIEKAMGRRSASARSSATRWSIFDQKRSATAFIPSRVSVWRASTPSFAVSSIPMAMKYYTEFKRQLTEQHRDLTIATIFSFAANEDDPEDALPEEGFLRRTRWTRPRARFSGRRHSGL